MGKFIDLVGRVFGGLTVTRKAKTTQSGHARWQCVCKCGNETTVYQSNLRRGTASCGCRRSEVTTREKTTHGYRHSRTYASWSSMAQRCTNPNYRGNGFERYQNVKICPRWMKFENFLADMGERPEGTTLGRILDTGNYEPGNAFWQTPAEQGLARRNLRSVLKATSSHRWEYRGDRWRIAA